MKPLASYFALMILPGVLSARASSVPPEPLRTIADISRFIRDNSGKTRNFDVTASVFRVSSRHKHPYAGDGHFSFELFSIPEVPFRDGDRARLRGSVYTSNVGMLAHVNSLEVVSHGAPPGPFDCTTADLLTGRYDQNYVRIKGEIVDAYYDDIDPNFSYFTVMANGSTTFVNMMCRPPLDALHARIGSQVAVSGICQKPAPIRPYLNREIGIAGPDDLTVLTPPPDDPFDVPNLFANSNNPTGTSRRSVCGRVAAAWGDSCFLLRAADGRIVQVATLTANLPDANACVDVVGHPSVNAYNKNLVRGLWRARSEDQPPDPPPQDLSARQLLFDPSGRARIDAKNHGRIVRLRGTVRGFSDSGGCGAEALVEDDGVFFRLCEGGAHGAFGDLPAGSRIEATAACVIELGAGQPTAPAQHIRDIFLVLRTPGDLRVVSRPPWWTPGRLAALVFALLSALTGIGIWNVLLNRRSERRGRELAEERLAHVTSELKVMERTRLAVELHDTLAQNLTGISLEVQAARTKLRSDPDKSDARLALAGKSLESCRRELRNCLRDLRSDALEKQDMDEAIRMTLEPHVGNARVAVRFSVPRERLTDNAAHTILRIVRELVLNALRHGNATAVRVAGSIEDDRLLFSVRDDGCGFDPDNRPGEKDGHFGLLGIRERVNAFSGDMRISSQPGMGTKVSVSIRLPHARE